MLLHAETSSLVLVDYQARLLPALHHGQRALDQALRLAQLARLAGVPAVATAQYPHKLGDNPAALTALTGRTLSKQHFDACADGLVDALPAHRSEIVLAGCETHVCLLQTACGLLARGYGVWVVADACASRRDSDHQLALARLRDNGARVISTEMAGFEWLRHGEHPAFRDALSLIRPL